MDLNDPKLQEAIKAWAESQEKWTAFWKKLGTRIAYGVLGAVIGGGVVGYLCWLSH